MPTSGLAVGGDGAGGDVQSGKQRVGAMADIIVADALQITISLVLRIVVAAGCCLGIWCSWTLARADYLFHKDTEASVRAAIALAPDAWTYYMRLAQLDSAHAQELLATALRLNRYNAEADIELGMQYEAKGDFARAGDSLLEAYAVDHTYLPRWSLANYYFRRDNMPAFWNWARRAAAIPSDEIGGLFNLCWHVTSNPYEITAEIANNKPRFLRQYLAFLRTRNQLGAAYALALRLVRYGQPETDRRLLFSVVNQLVAADDADAAVSLWHALIARHWVVADATVPNDANFARVPLPVSFDWSVLEYAGMYSLPGPAGLETDFSGSEPESCTIAEQVVALKPGNYVLDYSYVTSGIAPDTGIHWQIVDARSNLVLANSPDLSSDVLQHGMLKFSVPQGALLLHLGVVYQRPSGMSRISGKLAIQSTHIQAGPS